MSRSLASICLSAFLVWLALLALPAHSLFGQLLSPPKNVAQESQSVVRTMLGPEWSFRGSKSTPATFAQASRKDAPVLLGYALNLFRYGDVEKGLEITTEINQRYPANLDGWMLTTWYHTLTDDYDQALIAMKQLVSKVAKRPGLDAGKQKMVYRRLGRLVGYLEGPVRSSVNEDVLDSVTMAILKGLQDPSKATFQQARDSVKQKYLDMRKEHETVQSAELAKAKVFDDQKAERIKQDNRRLEETQTRLDPQKAELRSRANSEINQLQRQADSALYQLNQANANVAAIERDLLALYSQWNFNRANDYYGDDFFLSNQIRQAEFALAQARNNAFSAGSQVASLQNQIVRSRRGYSAQIGQLDAEIQQAKKSMRRNDGKLERLAKGPKIADGKISGRRNRRTSLRTYDEISLELYRNQLLEAIQ